jgi:hypothetical protein
MAAAEQLLELTRQAAIAARHSIVPPGASTDPLRNPGSRPVLLSAGDTPQNAIAGARNATAA